MEEPEQTQAYLALDPLAFASASRALLRAPWTDYSRQPQDCDGKAILVLKDHRQNFLEAFGGGVDILRTCGMLFVDWHIVGRVKVYGWIPFIGQIRLNST
jgi:hypothetical protein